MHTSKFQLGELAAVGFISIIASHHPVDPVDHPVDPVDHPVDPVDHSVDPVDHRVDPVDYLVDPVDYPVDPVDACTQTQQNAVIPFAHVFVHLHSQWYLECYNLCAWLTLPLFY